MSRVAEKQFANKYWTIHILTDCTATYVYIDDDEELLLQNMRYTERNAIFRR